MLMVDATNNLDADPRGEAWSPRRRAIVSLLLAIHLIAIFSAPWSFPQPASQLAGRVASFFRPYLQAGYLFNGYRFFAPNPGPSHLVRYELVDAAGNVDGQMHRFPNLDEQWPRLLYHRHFMVAERVNDFSDMQLVPPAEFVDQADRDRYFSTRSRLEYLLLGIGRQLRREHGASRVRIYAQEHMLPSPEEVIAGAKLQDERFYQERYLGELAQDEKWHWPEQESGTTAELLP